MLEWVAVPFSRESLIDHFQFALIHGPDIPGSYAILLFTASDLASITSHRYSTVAVTTHLARAATPCLRSGAEAGGPHAGEEAAKRSYPTSEVRGKQPRVPGCDGTETAERSSPTSEVRGGGQEELPHARGQGLQLVGRGGGREVILCNPHCVVHRACGVGSNLC